MFKQQSTISYVKIKIISGHWSLMSHNTNRYICVVNGKDVKPIHIIYAKWWHSEPLINANLPVKESYIYMWYSLVLHEIKYCRKIEMFIQNI